MNFSFLLGLCCFNLIHGRYLLVDVDHQQAPPRIQVTKPPVPSCIPPKGECFYKTKLSISLEFSARSLKDTSRILMECCQGYACVSGMCLKPQINIDGLGKMSGIENSRALSKNDYSTIKDGEIRTFRKDKSTHPHCTLVTNPDNPNIIEFNIEKQRNVPGEADVMLRLVAKIGTDLTKRYGRVDYLPGYIQNIDVEPEAGGCGLGTILLRLSMNEDDFHGIHGIAQGQRNIAVDSLDEPQFLEIQGWAKSTCKKVILAEVSVRGGDQEKAVKYFEGPEKTGFTIMFIKRETDGGNPSLYPSTGACSVKTLEERYDGNGGMVDEDGNRLVVTGDNMQWFWCFPNDEAEVQQCTKCQCSIS